MAVAEIIDQVEKLTVLELNELVKNRVTSHQRKRKIEVRYDMEQLSGLL